MASDTGWWFRSERFDDGLPTEPIEIVLGKPTDIPDTDLPGLLPTPPLSVDDDTWVSELTATLAQDGIDFTATGTTTKTPTPVSYRYTGRLVLAPSPDIARAATEVLSVGVSNPTIVFLPATIGGPPLGPSLPAAIVAEVLNLLRVFIMRELGPQIRTGIERRVNAAVISSVGRSLPGGALPAGVILSVRTISITPQRIQVRGALGAFGGVLSRLPALATDGGGNGGICFIATALYGADSSEVATLRAFRDDRLSTTSIGRWLTRLYARASPGMAAIISRSPFLKAMSRTLIVGPAVRLAKRIRG